MESQTQTHTTPTEIAAYLEALYPTIGERARDGVELYLKGEVQKLPKSKLLKDDRWKVNGYTCSIAGKFCTCPDADDGAPKHNEGPLCEHRIAAMLQKRLGAPAQGNSGVSVGDALPAVDVDVPLSEMLDGTPDETPVPAPAAPLLKAKAPTHERKVHVKEIAEDELVYTGKRDSSTSIPEFLSVAKLRTDGGTQPRAGISEDVVSDYAEQITGVDEWPFPPVVVYYDGDAYWLADGFHRVAAARAFSEAQHLTDFTIPAEVYQGERRDAILHSVGANAEHGLRRSNEDKRRAVLRLLNDEEWGLWSDREIARRARVSNRFVGNLRNELTVNGSQSTLRKGADGRTTDTANIGKVKIVPASTGQGDKFTLQARVAAVNLVLQEQPEAADTILDDLRNGRRGWYHDLILCYTDDTDAETWRRVAREIDAKSPAALSPDSGNGPATAKAPVPLRPANGTGNGSNGNNGHSTAACRACHRPLTDPASAASGIGPCCAQRERMGGGGDGAGDGYMGGMVIDGEVIVLDDGRGQTPALTPAPTSSPAPTPAQKASARNLLRTLGYGVNYFKPHPAAAELGVEQEWDEAWTAIQALIHRLEVLAGKGVMA